MKSIDDALTRLPEVLKKIAKEIAHRGGNAYLVGGWVRDALLGFPSKDYDIEVYALTEKGLLEVLSLFGRPGLVGKAFGVYLLTVDGEDFEFAFPRTEEKCGIGHTAFTIQSDPWLDFETASKRRDFTINSMGVSLKNGILTDPNSGLKDLELKTLRHVSDAFSEDPLRALRAVQFSARFELTIAPETMVLCSKQDLSELSSERFYDEFQKLLFKASRPSIGLSNLVAMDLTRFFPEIAQFSDELIDIEWQSLLRTVDTAAEKRGEVTKEEEILQFSVLCSHMPIQVVESFLKRMTRDVKLIKGVKALTRSYRILIEGFKKSIEPTEGWVRRLALNASLRDQAFIAGAMLCGRGDVEYENISSWIEKRARAVGVWDAPPEPLLTGKLLMEIGVKPGPHMGVLIKESFELQLDGVLDTKEELVDWVRNQLS
ncbi:MAG: CCA tRNA nucleotidyltransferase [Fibrobacterales bacterium]